MAILIISPKEVYATARLKEEFKKAGLPGIFFDVNDLAVRRFSVKLSKYSGLYIRQAYPYQTAVTQLALRFAHSRKPIVDANIIRATQDSGKWGVYQTLMQHGVSIPQTVLLSSQSVSQDDTRAYPYILKWIYGFGGQHVYLIKTKDDAHRVLQKYPPEQLLVQEFIEAQYEYKVMTVGYNSLPVVLKFKTSGKYFRPDFKNYKILDCHPERSEGSLHEIPRQARNDSREEEVIALAERAARVLGRELAKVDIIQDAEGELFILEVNRWPGFQNFEKLTGYNVAGEFVGYLQKKLK